MVDIKTAETGRGAAWLIEGFEYFRRSAGAWIGTALILFVLYVTSIIIPIPGIIFQIIMPVFIGGLILGCQEINNGGKLQINHLFAGFKHSAGNLILISVLYTLGSVVIIAIMLLMLFITIGLEFISIIMQGNHEDIIQNLDINHLRTLLLVILTGLLFYLPLLMAFWFAPALIVLDDQGVLESIKFSFIGCLKNFMPFLLYGVLGMGLSILAIITIGLGLFILMPMVIASVYLAYLDIFQTTKPATVV